MVHSWYHLPVGLLFLALTLGLRVLSVNRLIHNKLRIGIGLSFGFLVLHLVLTQGWVEPDLADTLRSIEVLLLVFAAVSTLVVVLVNPIRVDRVPDRFPSIVQDALTYGVFLLIATFVMRERFLTTSAVSAVVLGFALQDTLGNMFAGLAIQVDKPFRVGHWIAVSSMEGLVTQITWRATKLRTKTGNFVIVPNSVIGKEPITNYSEPAVPTRLQLEVGVSYNAAPNDVKQAIHEVLSAEPLVLKAPMPDVLLSDFGNSAIVYRVRFWVDDYSRDEVVRDRIRSGIYYAFQRRQIEIPYPIQVEYSREWPSGRSADRTAGLLRLAESIDLLQSLTPAERAELVDLSTERLYGDNETVVRQGEPGSSMFLIYSGRLRVTVEPSGAEVAVVEAGGYIGEMSLLTGDVRSATVTARGDAVLLEITAAIFRRIVLANPTVLERITSVIEARRAELVEKAAMAATGPAAIPGGPTPLLRKIQRFFGLTSDAR
ncbi:MAG: mechanosensitive ion channel domain-containing protein [Vicinamibacterales bacterium]